jgi:hypothetical protein
VQQIFADFDLIGETNEVLSVRGMTKRYSAQEIASSWMIYGRKQNGFLTLLESCAIFFDTNNVIIAHQYNRND